jgi:hypothetical protein
MEKKINYIEKTMRAWNAFCVITVALSVIGTAAVAVISYWEDISRSVTKCVKRVRVFLKKGAYTPPEID